MTFLFHLSALFLLFETWQEPSMPLKDFFLAACVGLAKDALLIRPSLDEATNFIQPKLRQWRLEFLQYFALDALSGDLPSSGPFHHSQAPGCMLPAPSHPHRQPRDALRQATREHSRDTRHQAPPSMVPTPRRDSHREGPREGPRRPQPPRLQNTAGTNVAHVCLIRKTSSPDTRTIITLLQLLE